MRFRLLFFFVLIPWSLALAQGEGNIWYFGAFAGVDFSTGIPNPLYDGKMSTNEGCAVLSDPDGHLLMYTDGRKIWNRNHQIMPNGSGLNGHSSSTQSAIIIPQPGSHQFYYIFTVDVEGMSHGLQFSIVDISKDGGLGDVVVKNQQLASPVAEKLTAVRHQNDRDIWIVAHRWNSNQFLAYLLTDQGLNTSPVTSSIGASHDGNPRNAIGQMKANTQGTKLAVAVYNDSFVEVFDYNNLTGTVNAPIHIESVFPYGIEFSPNGCFLYFSYKENAKQALQQINLEAGSPQDIINSATFIGSTNKPEGGALQLAPDGKIYNAKHNAQYLNVINQPNKKGTACQFESNGFFLDGRSSLLGLPAFFPDFFPEISARYFCLGDTTRFDITMLKPSDQYQWNFGDPASGIDNEDTGSSVWHVYSDTGRFEVTAVQDRDGVLDTFRRTVIIKQGPVALFPSDTVICKGTSLQVDAGKGNIGATYQWNNGSTGPIQTITEAGTYQVTVTTACGTLAKAIDVKFSEVDFSLPAEASACSPQLATIHADFSGITTITWPDGSTDSTFTTSQSGPVIATATNAKGCQESDTTQVNIFETIGPDLGADTIICLDSSLTLIIEPSLFSDWQWSTGSNAREIQLSEAGTVSITTTDHNGCMAVDTLQVMQEECPEHFLAVPNAFTPNNDGLNDYFRPVTQGIELRGMRIYNRWGEMVYDGLAETGWDGFHGDAQSPIGVYAYVIKYIADNKMKVNTGNVTLIR